MHRCVGDFSRFFTQPSLGAALLVGGVDGGRQLQQLKGGVDVVCGTPGRVADLVKQGKLRLSAVQFFVLDEADRLLDTGNLDTILQLHAKLPRTGRTGGRLQTLLFSATLHTAEVPELLEEFEALERRRMASMGSMLRAYVRLYRSTAAESAVAQWCMEEAVNTHRTFEETLGSLRTLG